MIGKGFEAVEETDRFQPSTVDAFPTGLPPQLVLASLPIVGRQVIAEKVVRGPLGFANVLVVLEDGVEVVQAGGGQQAQGGDEICHRAGDEGAPGEADEDNVVSVDVVCADEVVHLADDLAKSERV